LEIGWAIGLKYTEGFTRLWPSLLTVAAMIVRLGFLGLALKTLPVGTVDRHRRGRHCALCIYLIAEPATALRLGSIALIIGGIIGLKLVG
jgi:quaternary ammonium compound-resistance protein SugE